MSLRINTNVAALNAYNSLNRNQNSLESAFEKLSSGRRINKAADDASGLSIAQGLTSQIEGMTQAVRNANDATNVAQIADGALGTVQDVLHRMRDLVLQAGNTGTQGATSWSAISDEINNLNDELDNIGKHTKFGDTELLNGSYDGIFQVGADAGNVIELNLSTTISASALSLDNLAIATLSGTTAYTNSSGSGAQADLAAIDDAINTVSQARSKIGAIQNQLSYTTTNLNTAITNVSASRSNLTDADLAHEVTAMTQQQILTSAATSVLAQANAAPQAILKLLQ